METPSSMKVVEVFESLQGEGNYAGYPVTFVRLSGCTRRCSYCDTSYHQSGDEISVTALADKIKTFKSHKVVWTGGEPALQEQGIEQVMVLLSTNYAHHLETNGDLLMNYSRFNYVACSPKSLSAAQNITTFMRALQRNSYTYDIKVVTDLAEVGTDLIPYATTLMPLTLLEDSDKKSEVALQEANKLLEQKVWQYCVDNQLKFSLRQHVHVWGSKKREV